MSKPDPMRWAISNAGSPLTLICELGPDWGWSHHRVGETEVSVKGYLFDGLATHEGANAAACAARLLTLPAEASDQEVASALGKLAGHFALVVSTPRRTIATVDRVRSIPLMYGEKDGQLHIDDRGRRLRDRLGLKVEDIDPEQALAAAMSGYTIGGKTLYRGMSELGVGEALVVDVRGARPLCWFTYDAWKPSIAIASPEKALSELHGFLLERLVASADGRAIAVPLSAGYDSRFLAAGLKHLGYKEVRLFSYGRIGNHEAETARAIAERLGYPWRMVGYTTANQRAKVRDRDYDRALWNEMESCVATPFEQDWTAIESLRKDGYIPANALIVNGQSGDFITGNHAPVGLMDLPRHLSPDERRVKMFKPFFKKHYRLWDALVSPANDAVVERLLTDGALKAGADFSPDQHVWGIYEYLEYVNRQAKYVVSGQRAYEAMGLGWRLPLWDDEFIQFWRHAPAELKREQSLYRRVLERDNWGGVFQGIPVNRKTITPAWIRPVRLAFKAAHLPLGRERWHKFERRVFGWWMDGLRMGAYVPYSRVLGDGRGARNPVSWLTERWLQSHGLAWTGRLPESG